MNRHRQAHAIRQLSLRRLTARRLRGRNCIKSVVNPFSVIQIGESDIAAAHLPILPGADHLFLPVLINQTKLRHKLPFIAVKTHIFFGEKTKAGLIPAVAQQNAQGSPLLQAGGDIEGLVLHPLLVIIAIGGQVFLPDALQGFALRQIIGLIQPKSAYIQPGAGYRLGRRNLLLKIGMPIAGYHPLCGVGGNGLHGPAGNPLAGPRLLPLSGLEPLGFPHGLLSPIAPDCHRPVVSGPGAQADICPIAQRVRLPVKAGIKYYILQLLVQSHQKPCALLRLS